jgi:hypothetical protein
MRESKKNFRFHRVIIHMFENNLSPLDPKNEDVLGENDSVSHALPFSGVDLG